VSGQELGQRGEDLAAAHLTRLGWRLVCRNWRCPRGEIDIIAVDDQALVFCEVKTRAGLGYGDPLEAITYAKVTKLRELASYWLQTNPVRGAVRFDAIGVVIERGCEPRLSHVRGVTT
jgi:putative endonuclease